LEWVERMHGKNIHTTYLWLWSWDKEKENWDSQKEGRKTKRVEGVRREGKIKNLVNKVLGKRIFWEWNERGTRGWKRKRRESLKKEKAQIKREREKEEKLEKEKEKKEKKEYKEKESKKRCKV